MPTTVVRDIRLAPADVDVMCGNIYKMGGYGLGLFKVMDLGIPQELYERHLRESIENLRQLSGPEPGGVPLRPPHSRGRALLEASNEIWDYPQNLRFAAAVSILGQYYKRWMKADDLKRALSAKVLYNCQIGILDDLVDKGDYNYLEAKELTHLVLSSMFNPTYDDNAFVKKLIPSLRESHLEYRDMILQFASAFNSLISLSAHGGDFFYHMEVFNQRLVLAQALSVFQKTNEYNLAKVKRVANQFYAPDGDIHWYDKVANAQSGGTQYNLIDMSFCERRFDPVKLRNFLRAWWYFDAITTFLNGVITVYDDLRNRIVNASLIAMREDEVLNLTTPQGYDPALTREDYEAHLKWVAELARRGLSLVDKDVGDPDSYFPFMVVMMPLMLMAEAVGSADEMIRFYLAGISPSVRDIVNRSAAGARGRAVLPIKPRPKART